MLNRLIKIAAGELGGPPSPRSEPISSSEDDSDDQSARRRRASNLRAELQQQAFGPVPAHDADTSVDEFLMAGANRERGLVRSHSGAASSVGSGPESPMMGSLSGAESPASIVTPRRPVAQSSHQPQRNSGGTSSSSSSSGLTNNILNTNQY